MCEKNQNAIVKSSVRLPSGEQHAQPGWIGGLLDQLVDFVLYAETFRGDLVGHDSERLVGQGRHILLIGVFDLGGAVIFADVCQRTGSLEARRFRYCFSCSRLALRPLHLFEGDIPD